MSGSFQTFFGSIDVDGGISVIVVHACDINCL